MLIPMVAVKMIAIQKWRCHCIGAPDDNLTDSESDELISDNVTSVLQLNVIILLERKNSFTIDVMRMAVSSIENALDEENYEPIDYSHVSIENVAVLLEKKGKNVTKSINWTTEKPTQTVRQAPQNVIRNRPGVKREFRTAVEPIDA